MTPIGSDRAKTSSRRTLRREAISPQTIRRVLVTGRAFKADITIVDTADGPVVVKDYGSKGWLARLLGRFQIARETRAYARLGPQPGIPAFYGRIDTHALAVEFLEGVELDHVPDKIAHADMLMAQIEDIVRRIHACGVVHFDLRSRKNMIITEDRRLHIIDFGGSQWLRPGGIAHRIAFGVLRGVDEVALLKYRHMLELEFSEAELKRWHHHHRLRSLWPFNRKRKGRNKDRWRMDGSKPVRAPARPLRPESGEASSSGVAGGR